MSLGSSPTPEIEPGNLEFHLAFTALRSKLEEAIETQQLLEGTDYRSFRLIGPGQLNDTAYARLLLVDPELSRSNFHEASQNVIDVALPIEELDHLKPKVVNSAEDHHFLLFQPGGEEGYTQVTPDTISVFQEAYPTFFMRSLGYKVLPI